MRTRFLILLSIMTLVLAACSSPQRDGAPESGEGVAPEPVLLSYELADGGSFEYEVTVEQTINVSAEGSGDALAGEEIPESADIKVLGSGLFAFDVADGPDEGTYEVTITGELTDLSVTGTIDGEPVDSEVAPEFAAIEPVSVTLVVDEKGNVIPSDSSIDDPFGGLLGGLEGMGNLGADSIPGANLGQFFGPPFDDEAVTVGDEWSTSFETPGFGSEPITTTVNSEVTGTESMDNAEVLVIDTTTTTGAFEINLADFFIGLFTGFLPDDASPEDQAKIDTLVENLRFVISSDETTANSTTYFDPELGITRLFQVSSLANLGFDLNFPDEETGELSGFLMDMTIDQKIDYLLLSSESA